MTIYMKYTAIIFDFNGVILWDRAWHEAAWNALSLKLRGKTFTKDELEEYVHGRTPKTTLTFLLRGVESTKGIELLQEKEKLYQKIALASPKFKLSPGAEKLFNALRAHGIRQTIATSSPRFHMLFYYRHLHLARWFPMRDIIYNNGKIPGKPAPDIFLIAARKLKVDVHKCIVVEDAISGLEGAKNAGAGKIIALTDGDNYEKIKKISCVDKIVKNLGGITIKDFEV